MSGNAGNQQARGKRAEDLAIAYLQSQECQLVARYRRGTKKNPIHDFDIKCPGEEVKRIEVKETKKIVPEKRRGKPSFRPGRFVMKPKEDRDCYAFLVDDTYSNDVTLDFVRADAIDPLYPHRGASPKLSIEKVQKVRMEKCFEWANEGIIIPRTTLG